MRRGTLRLAVPAFVLAAAVACNQKPDPPAASEPGPAQGATENAVTPPAAPASPPAPTPPQASALAEPGSPLAPPAGRPSAPTPAAPPTAPAGPSVAPAPGAPAGPPAAAPAPAAPAAPAAPRPVPVRMITVPADTPLRLTLVDAVGSDTSAVEDRVAARVAADVDVDGETVIPEGSRVSGVVTYAKPSAKVKGRAAITVRFRTVSIGSRTYDISAEPLRREAAGTKAKDARNIGIGAGAGAVIGGILGGGKGAGIGAAVGGAGGTGVVLATKGKEVHLPAGTAVSTRLDAPLSVEMRH